MAYSLSGRMGVNYTVTTAGTTTDGANALFPLGMLDTGTDGTVWMYVQAGAAITQYDAVLINEDFQAVPMTTTLATEASGSAGDFVGFAQVAFSDNDLGWVAIKGSNIECRLSASCAADVMLYSTASAGVLDDASAGVLLNGVGAVAAGTAATNAEIIASNVVSRLATGLAA